MSLEVYERAPVVLPRRVVPQPQPHIFAGGDCGACALGGLLQITPREVYDRFRGSVNSLEWPTMEAALLKAKREGLLDRVISDVPLWPGDMWSGGAFATFGHPASAQSLSWYGYLCMAIDAGYYALAAVNFAKAGPLSHGADHWVMICGHRQRRVPNARVEGAWNLPQELLVSCSAKSTPDEEWVEVNEFLRDRGGFNLLLARPA